MSRPDHHHNLTEEVSSSNTSCRCVEYVGHWKNTPISSVINHPSSPASVAFTFNGTQVGVFGFINGGPPQVSLIGPSLSSSNYIPQSHHASDHNQGGPGHNQGGPGHSQGGPGAIFITDALPCDQYTVKFTVGKGQAMEVQRFGYAPCPPGTAPSAYKGSSSIPPGTFPDAGAGAKPLSAALIAIIALCSVVVFFALAGLVLLLYMRRQRQRKRQGSRSLFGWSYSWLRLPSHRPKLSPSAQYLASATDTGIGGGGDGKGDGGLELRDSTATTMEMAMFGAASASRAALLVPFQVTAESSLSPPWWEAKGVEKKLPPQVLDDSDVDSDSDGRVVHGFLSDQKESTASQMHDQLQASDGLSPPNGARSSSPPHYEFRAL